MIVIQLKHIGYTRAVTWPRARHLIVITGALLLLPTVGVGLAGGARAQSDDDAAAQAAAEIQSARDRANARNVGIAGLLQKAGIGDIDGMTDEARFEARPQAHIAADCLAV